MQLRGAVHRCAAIEDVILDFEYSCYFCSLSSNTEPNRRYSRWLPSISSVLFQPAFSLSHSVIRYFLSLRPSATRTKEANMESETSDKLMKRVSDAPQSQRAATGPPTPAPPSSDNTPIETTPLKIKKRRNLTTEERLRVAETRKRGACQECRRKHVAVCSSLFRKSKR